MFVRQSPRRTASASPFPADILPTCLCETVEMVALYEAVWRPNGHHRHGLGRLVMMGSSVRFRASAPVSLRIHICASPRPRPAIRRDLPSPRRGMVTTSPGLCDPARSAMWLPDPTNQGRREAHGPAGTGETHGLSLIHI